jgi:hypothetical protein
VISVMALTLVAATGHLRPLASLQVRAARLLVAAAAVQVGTASLAPGSAVVVANGAMPVSTVAAAEAGIGTEALRLGEDPLRERLDDHTRLALLADRVPVPAPGWSQVVSAGDVLVAAGLGLLLVAGSVPRTPQRHRRPQGHRPVGQPPRRAERSMALAMESTTRGSYS